MLLGHSSLVWQWKKSICESTEHGSLKRTVKAFCRRLLSGGGGGCHGNTLAAKSCWKRIIWFKIQLVRCFFKLVILLPVKSESCGQVANKALKKLINKDCLQKLQFGRDMFVTYLVEIIYLASTLLNTSSIYYLVLGKYIMQLTF